MIVYTIYWLISYFIYRSLNFVIDVNIVIVAITVIINYNNYNML